MFYKKNLTGLSGLDVSAAILCSTGQPRFELARVRGGGASASAHTYAHKSLILSEHCIYTKYIEIY